MTKVTDFYPSNEDAESLERFDALAIDAGTADPGKYFQTGVAHDAIGLIEMTHTVCEPHSAQAHVSLFTICESKLADLVPILGAADVKDDRPMPGSV